MGKGSKRRPQVISDDKMEDNWQKIFGTKKPTSEWKPRKVIPSHARTRVEPDKKKRIPRKEKYKHINNIGE